MLVIKNLCIDEFATGVIERIDEFNSINEKIDKDNSFAKGQKSIRKKALVDFFKTLRQLGLSPRCSSLFGQHQDPEYIFKQPTVNQMESDFYISDNQIHSEIQSLWLKSDSYFVRIISRSSSIRELALMSHADLSGSDREKSISFVEHLLHILLRYIYIYIYI